MIRNKMYIKVKSLIVFFRKQQGISTIEASVVLCILLPLLFFIMDISRVAYIETTIRSSLTESIKRFEGDKTLLYNVWNNDSSDPDFDNFKNSRDNLIKYALVKMQGILFSGVKFKSVSHYDNSQDTSSVYTGKLSYMPPGYSGKVGGLNKYVMNPNKCSSKNNPDCHQSSAINELDSNQSLVKLSMTYPTTLTAYAEVQTLFMGKKIFEIQVAGYPTSSMSYTPNSDIVQNLQGPTCQAAAQQTSQSFCWDYNNAQDNMVKNIFGAFFGNHSPSLSDLQSAGNVSDPLLLSKFRNLDSMYRDSFGDVTFGASSVCFKTNNPNLYIDAQQSLIGNNNHQAFNCSKNACGAQYCTRLGAGCFSPETKIRMADGNLKAIEDIQLTEQVMNPINHKPVSIKYLIKGPELKKMYIFLVNSNSIKVTETHPMYTQRGIIKAQDILITDKLQLEDGKLYKIDKISKPKVQKGQEVYNIELETKSLDSKERALSADGIITGDFKIQQLISK